ncbi:MAG TPA: dTMP kinase [Anaerolineaceae bacterium]|nr:dTMP kinase [Anaerolineaceae bacterium]
MFITLEGPDGSGKSTQVQPLAEYLRQEGYTVFTTREPGGTTISDQVREVLMRLDNRSMYPRTETLLFCAARAQLVEEVIRPRLQRGEIILCDRYADSTLAYQGYGHGNDLLALQQLLDFATGGLWPDLTILFDIDAIAGLNRRKIGGGEWNRLDDYQIAFHQRVRDGYLAMAHKDPKRWAIVNADQEIEKVQADLRRLVLERIKTARS